ncbi:MAG: HAD superfamily hydrolase (TIGR01509 family) [Cellvibrionaceae bacterium]|jgi:HAD superfamily hydrolase (TIGR01509 family)
MLNWDEIDTVMLDMDGTLLDLYYDNHFWMIHLPQRFAQIKKIERKIAQQQVLEHIRAVEGTLQWYCLDYWSDRLGVDVVKLKKEIRCKIKERPHARELLNRLGQSKKTIYLVTNSHPAGVAIKMDEIQIEAHFKEIISSHQFGYPKEQLAFWQSLDQHLSFDRKRTLFIDDNLTVLNTAIAFGIKHILGIHQPDSTVHRTVDQVPAIHHFDEILDGLSHG